MYGELGRKENIDLCSYYNAPPFFSLEISKRCIKCGGSVVSPNTLPTMVTVGQAVRITYSCGTVALYGRFFLKIWRTIYGPPYLKKTKKDHK